jgi:hypothetical protein
MTLKCRGFFPHCLPFPGQHKQQQQHLEGEVHVLVRRVAALGYSVVASLFQVSQCPLLMIIGPRRSNFPASSSSRTSQHTSPQ